MSDLSKPSNSKSTLQTKQISTNNDIHVITDKLVAFAKARDWQKFHAPKNLAMALSVEASELVEIFQWLSTEESYQLNDETHKHAAQEIADIFLYSLLLCEKLNIDLIDAAHKKMLLNHEKYPIEQCFGHAKKHN